MKRLFFVVVGCLASSLPRAFAGLLDDLPREVLIESLSQRERLVSSLEVQLKAAHAEVSRLRTAVEMLSAPGPAEEPRVLGANSASLRAEVRRFIRASSAAAGGGAEEPPWAAPQHVSVTCTGGEVNVNSRPLAVDDRGDGECLLFDVSAGDLSARFALFCDDEDDEEGAGGGAEAAAAAAAAAADADLEEEFAVPPL